MLQLFKIVIFSWEKSMAHFGNTCLRPLPATSLRWISIKFKKGKNKPTSSTRKTYVFFFFQFLVSEIYKLHLMYIHTGQPKSSFEQLAAKPAALMKEAR